MHTEIKAATKVSVVKAKTNHANIFSVNYEI